MMETTARKGLIDQLNRKANGLEPAPTPDPERRLDDMTERVEAPVSGVELRPNPIEIVGKHPTEGGGNARHRRFLLRSNRYAERLPEEATPLERL